MPSFFQAFRSVNCPSLGYISTTTYGVGRYILHTSWWWNKAAFQHHFLPPPSGLTRKTSCGFPPLNPNHPDHPDHPPRRPGLPLASPTSTNRLRTIHTIIFREGSKGLPSLPCLLSSLSPSFLLCIRLLFPALLLAFGGPTCSYSLSPPLHCLSLPAVCRCLRGGLRETERLCVCGN